VFSDTSILLNTESVCLILEKRPDSRYAVIQLQYIKIDRE